MGVELNCVGVVLRLFCVVLYCVLCVCFICSCGLWVGGVAFCYCVALYVALLRRARFMVCFVCARIGVVL